VDVPGLLDGLLAEAVNALTLADREVPDRQLVAHGSVTFDCELLAVHLIHMRPKVADPRVERCAILHHATMQVTLLRCYPMVNDQGTPPSAVTLTAAGRGLAADGQALWKGLTRAWVEGSWPEGIPCSRVTWGVLEPIPPGGGLAGWRLEVAVRL
jgi:hypothetical protein